MSAWPVSKPNRARGVVEHELDAHVGVRLIAGFTIIEHRRRAVDAHVALDLHALRIGQDFQRLRFHLLAQHHLVGAKITDIERDGVIERAFRRIAHDREPDRYLPDHVAAARRRIDRGAGGLLETVERHEFGNSGDRTFDLEPRA